VRQQRADQDQRAVALRAELAQRGPGDVGRAEQIGGHHPLEHLGRQFLELPVRHDRGRVGPDVDAAVPVDRGLAEGLEIAAAGDVGGNDQRVGAAFPGHREQVLLAAGGQHHLVAPAGEGHGRRSADAAGRAGQDHYS
jgi:hypothetical protein